MTLLITLKAGGYGINLTKATYVYHMDPWWNPAAENQASERAHRIGQKSKVFVNKLIMKNSIEERILELQKSKKEIFDKIMNLSLKNENKITLSKNDFKFLIE